MKDILVRILDTVLPLPRSVREIKDESPERFLRFFVCHRSSNCIHLSDYTKTKVRSAITANKFHNSQKAARLLATLLDNWLQTQTDKKIVLVPIPLSKERQRTRGYNQVSQILSMVKSDKVIVKELLIRTKETLPQTTMDREHRLKNMTGAFSLASNQTVPSNCLIVLVDDVITTGATINEAGEVLRSNLPNESRLVYLALAH